MGCLDFRLGYRCGLSSGLRFGMFVLGYILICCVCVCEDSWHVNVDDGCGGLFLEERISCGCDMDMAWYGYVNGYVANGGGGVELRRKCSFCTPDRY